jgi:hypothetical protein
VIEIAVVHSPSPRVGRRAAGQITLVTVTTLGTCTHLSSSLVEHLGGRAWCVRCDGYVHADGSVVPRALVSRPPVKHPGRFKR